MPKAKTALPTDAAGVLALIAGSGSAMSTLDDASCVVREAVPAEQNPDGTLKEGGDPGSPAVTLGDLIRDVS